MATTSREGLDETVASPERGALADDGRARVGTTIAGRYELTALLGRGGMGTVYRAIDRELDDVVALKLLRPEIATAADAIERFRREVKLARRVTHKNVARTFELGEHEGSRYLTMEYVRGEPLSRLLERHGRLPVQRAAPILAEVCDGLDAAHAVGVVHRDVKPDNVLIAEGGRVVVTDFGIAREGVGAQAARLTRAPAGTPAYMAPEQLEGGAITARTDLYALGAMMFELLTGELPFGGDTAFAVALARLREPPRDPRAIVPALPAAAAALVLECLSRAPEGRPEAARDVAAALRAMASAVESSGTIAAASALGAAAEASSRTTPGAARPRALAVLPFRNGGAPDDEYLASGLTEDLLDALCTRRGIRVLAMGAVEGLRDRPRDAREAGRELGVDLVVEGSVRRAGGGLRVNVRLIEVESGYQAWAKRFDVSPEQILGVQDEAAQAIAAALSLDGGAPAREAPTDPAALDLYLRARHLFNLHTQADSEAAVELFEQALSRAPENPMLSSGLSMALVRRSFFMPSMDSVLFARARTAAERAARGAPLLGEPHLALAQLHLYTSDGAAAAREAREAIARAPSLADAHELLGRLLIEAGRVADGARRLEVAIGLDPKLDAAPWELLRVAALEGDWARFDARMASILGPSGERRSRWAFHARYAAWRGDREALLDTERGFERAHDTQGKPAEFVRQLLAVYLRREGVGETLAGQREIAKTAGLSPRLRQWLHQNRAEMAGFMGLRDEALDALRCADETMLFDLFWLERCPLLACVRGEPGYAEVLSSVRARADAVADAMWG